MAKCRSQGCLEEMLTEETELSRRNTELPWEGVVEPQFGWEEYKDGENQKMTNKGRPKQRAH